MDKGLMTWIKIDRDENGFATKKCLDAMFEHLPFVVARCFDNTDVRLYFVVTEHALQDYMGGITYEIHYTHYLPIPKLEV